jgi:hypothetical protein
MDLQQRRGGCRQTIRPATEDRAKAGQRDTTGAARTSPRRPCVRLCREAASARGAAFGHHRLLDLLHRGAHPHSALAVERQRGARQRNRAFIARDLGPTFYNRGLQDAQAVFAAKVEETADALYAMERKPGG